MVAVGCNKEDTVETRCADAFSSGKSGGRGNLFCCLLYITSSFLQVQVLSTGFLDCCRGRVAALVKCQRELSAHVPRLTGQSRWNEDPVSEGLQIQWEGLYDLPDGQ